jgi:hypothetical protein
VAFLDVGQSLHLIETAAADDADTDGLGIHKSSL